MHHVLLVACVLLCAACGSDPEPTRESSTIACERYREHLLDVRLSSLTSNREAHREALRTALGDDFVARCERDKTQADLDCIMAATTTEQLRTCRGGTR